mgnify:CR=1 FL=1
MSSGRLAVPTSKQGARARYLPRRGPGATVLEARKRTRAIGAVNQRAVMAMLESLLEEAQWTSDDFNEALLKDIVERVS